MKLTRRSSINWCKRHGRKISRVFGDSAYDSRAIFNYTASMGAEPVIKPRMNSTGKSRGSYVRAQTVREFLLDPQAWKKKHRYGQRWQVETVFSSLKRMVGEYFTSILDIGIYNEIMSSRTTWLTEMGAGCREQTLKIVRRPL